MTDLRILIVEDEKSFSLALKLKLQNFGKVFEANNLQSARNIIDSYPLDLAFIDLDLEQKNDGLELLENLAHKNIYRIILSARDDEKLIETAYEKGCNDYYVKGKDLRAIDTILKNYINRVEDDSLQKFIAQEFITNDPHTIEQLSLLKEVSNNTSPILLLGPTGTGKTLLARKIHEFSKCEGEFVELNCSAIPENLLESELFGHMKGAFTGAVSNKIGFLQKADKGIIFLDEIGALPLNLQAKLLKALEEKSFTPVGSTEVVKSDFRIVSATCEDLEGYRKNNQFRDDLYFRISGINLKIQALSERKGDIGLLINHFIKMSERRIVLSAETRNALIHYSWPGNVRELKKVIHLLLTKQKGCIDLTDLPTFITTASEENKPEGMLMTSEIKEMAKEIGLYETIELLKNEIMKSVSLDNNGKVNKTIQDLKISTNTYYKLIKNDSLNLQ